jgi:putative flippase GtrA
VARGDLGKIDAVKVRTRAERFGDFLTGWVDRLPAGLRPMVPRELVGFAILGAFTLGIDLALLSLLRATTPVPLGVAISIAYLTAFSLNFVLNRTINFQSHAPVGRQAIKYAFVVLGDYLLTLGVTTALSGLGLDFRIARLTASFCVALFTYTTSRYWVFRKRQPASTLTDPRPEAANRTRDDKLEHLP